MGKDTAIAWCDHTFNIAWGCVKISPGCKHCYADGIASNYGFDVWGPNKERRTFGPKYWQQLAIWNRDAEREGESHRVFTSSMCDIGEEHPTIQRELRRYWQEVRRTPFLDHLMLTKRAQRWPEILPADWGEGYENVWCGVSVESPEYAWRIEELRKTPARIRFVSYEPALADLGPVDLTGIHWLIYGGESGENFREHDVQWARDAQTNCHKYGTAFFYKQSAARRTEMGIQLDGQIVRNYPIPRRRVGAVASQLF